jgi:Transposase
VTRWITSHPDHLTEDETAQLSRIKARSPQLTATAGHVTAFAEMMTGRHGDRLPEWIAAVGRDDLPHLHSFTRGIRRDQAAVTNGLTLAYSSGAVEGNICRVKALKRQMSGRANLDLLRKRILLSPQASPARRSTAGLAVVAITDDAQVRCCLAGEEEHQVPGTAAPGLVIEGDVRVGLRLDCRIRRGLRCDRLGEGAGLVLVGRAEDQVLPAPDYGTALCAQPLRQLDGLATRRQIDAYQPSGLPGGSGLLSLVVHQAPTLCRPLLFTARHPDRRVFPVLFVWMPAVEPDPGGHELVLGKDLAHHPLRRASHVFGSGVKKQMRSVNRHRDPVPASTA